jgi:predicted alpha/beta hydrolase
VPSKLILAGIWYAVMPLTTKAIGFLPGQLGIGEHLPQGVAEEWARWCRSEGYFTDDDVPTDGYARVTAPTLAFSFADDAYAPKAAVDWLHRLYSSAPVESRHLTPAALGAKSVGHFGFFREAFGASLWAEAAAWLLRSPGTRPSASATATAAATA